MHARERMNEPLANRTSGAGLALPETPAGTRPSGAATTAGAVSRPALACLFCRYRRADEQEREVADA